MKPQDLLLKYAKPEWNSAVCVNYARFLLNQIPLPPPLLHLLHNLSSLIYMPYDTQPK